MAKRKAAKKVAKKVTKKKATKKGAVLPKKVAKKKATKKAATKKAATKKVATKKGPKVKDVAEVAIKQGKTNEEVLAVILKRCPGAKTTLNAVAWYRNDLRKRDKSVPYSREISFKRNAKKRGKIKPKVKQRNTSAPIGDAISAALRAGKTNQEVLVIIKKKHPKAKTTLNSIAWYRNDLRNRGEKVPYSWEIEPARKAKRSKTAKAAAAKRKAAAAPKK